MRANLAISDEPDPDDPPWEDGEVGIRISLRGFGVIPAAYQTETGSAVPLTAEGWFVFPSAEANPSGVDYVRVIDDEGNELVYWDQNEWAESPAEVMGAIMGVLIGGVRR